MLRRVDGDYAEVKSVRSVLKLEEYEGYREFPFDCCTTPLRYLP
jgi:hypothetical protein